MDNRGNRTVEQIGRYRILVELGRGAMGVVYKAHDPTISRMVAIKIIRLAELAHPQERKQLRDRLFREAQSAGALSHPGIVTIYDIAEQDDLAYITMEFVEGQTLERLLDSEVVCDAGLLISVACQTGLALDFAHSRGVVHRDIKPGNIMVTPEGAAKITDFGIAHIASSKYTQTGTVIGTPSYMSPEQVRGAAVDGRSDLFSLGVVAYEMLAGQAPFLGESVTSIIFKIVSEDPVPPKEINPAVGEKVNTVILRALAKDPAGRFQDCREFAEALQAAAGETQNLTAYKREALARLGVASPLPTVAVQSPVPAAMNELQTPAATKLLPPLETRKRGETKLGRAPAGRKKLWAAATVLGLLAAGGAAVIWQKRQPSTRSSLVGTSEPAPAPAAAALPAPPPAAASPAPLPAATVKAPRASARAKPEQEPAPAEPVTVNIVTEEPGASAVIDGNPETACNTPCSIPISPGRHSVLITQPGHHSEQREFTAGAEPFTLRFAVRPILGTLMIATDPPGAAVSINGKPVAGATPLTLKLPLGRHLIQAARAGAQTRQTVDITDESIITIRLSLTPP